MFDQLIGLVLLGLGLKNPVNGTVAGENTETLQNVRLENREERIENRQGRREEIYENVTQRREALKNKLSEFRDEHKKQLVERLNTRLGEVNKKRTNKMTEHLDKFEEVLAKLTTRSSDLKAKGKDTVNADNLLGSAKAAIDSAKSAVSTQAGKVYTPTILSETSAKTDVGNSMKTLQSDLKSVRELVQAARKALKDAALALRGLSDEPVETQ